MKHFTHLIILSLITMLSLAARAQFGPVPDSENVNSSIASIERSSSEHDSSVHAALRCEVGSTTVSDFVDDFGIKVWKGNWVIQADYRNYSGSPRHNSSGPNGMLSEGIGPITTTPIPDLSTTFDGYEEYSITIGKIVGSRSAFIIPSIGLAAVSKNIAHYQNCYQNSQETLFLLFPGTYTWNTFNVDVEQDVSLAIPVSLQAELKITSWLGLSATGWAELGAGIVGWSVGLEVGDLP